MRLACALALALAALPADAAPRALRHDLTLDLSLTAGGAAVVFGTELLKDRLAPERCRFCGTNALDRGARDLLVLGYGNVARRASDYFVLGVIPAGIAAHQLLAARAEGDVREGARDLLFVAEAAVVSTSLNQIVKFAVGRQRPFVHHGNFPEPDRRPDSDDNLSFYSGHTSLAFALASSAGTISSLRGYRSAPWVWGVGSTLAAAVGYFRIAADKHYLTDVLVGAAVGGGIGAAVPLLLHGREDRDPPIAGATARRGAQVIPLPLGVLVVF